MLLLVNVYDVVDGSMLRCTGSGIGSVSLFVSSMLTLDGSKLLSVCHLISSAHLFFIFL